MIRQKLRKFYKRKKKLSIALIVLAVFLIVAIGLPLSSGISKGEVTSYNGDNKYITFHNRCLISGRNSGSNIAPPNTLRALQESVTSESYKLDIIELNLRVTADGILILLQDEVLENSSNAREYFGKKKVIVSEKTYAELLGLNMAEHFMTAAGKYPYKGLRDSNIPSDLRVISLDETLAFLSRFPQLNYLINVNDTGDLGTKTMDTLYVRMAQFGILNKTIVSTNARLNDYIDARYPSVVRTAGMGEIWEFYFSSIFNADLSKKDIRYKVLQLPYGNFGVNFGKKSIVDYAHKYDIAVHYYTVNKAEGIAHLSDIGSDAVITTSPDIAYKVIYKR